jgi:nitrile hydratase beta subunit
MNGVHDMGGMHGMGDIPYEENEPVFHEAWEARVYAMTRVLRTAGGRWNLDAGRHELELLPAAEYLRMSYYERWAARLVNQLCKTGLATEVEIETGLPDPGSRKTAPAVTADMVPAMIARRASARRTAGADPRFTVGQRVRARNLNPQGHTRLPRYVRGKLGTIATDRGMFVFPDTNAHLLGEKPQHLYSVRFAARELWGEQASPRDAVYLDLWDDYLEHA